MGRKRKPKPTPQEAEEQALREERSVDGAFEERKKREDQLIRHAGWVRPDDANLQRAADRVLMQGQAELLEKVDELSALLKGYEALKAPSNDPEYLAKLQNAEKTRAELSNEVVAVHIVPDPQDVGRKWISLGLADPRNPGKALETARQLGQHLEARVINHETDQ